MDIKDRIEAARNALWPIVCKVQTEDCHWLSGPDALVDEALDYCGPCAKKRLAKLQKNHPGKEFFISCSCGGHETESVSSCEDCGVILDYVLLKYGVKSELAHFLENGVAGKDGGLPADNAYAIDRILNSVSYSQDTDDLADAVSIAESAVALIGYSNDVARLADDGCPIPAR